MFTEEGLINSLYHNVISISCNTCFALCIVIKDTYSL